MSIHIQIEEQLISEYAPRYLEVINESHQHSGPAKESHFKVVLVSDTFNDVQRLQRHRLVNASLQAAFDAGLHALSLKLYTQAEWEAQHGQVPPSPPCMGGSKLEAKLKSVHPKS